MQVGSKARRGERRCTHLIASVSSAVAHRDRRGALSASCCDPVVRSSLSDVSETVKFRQNYPGARMNPGILKLSTGQRQSARVTERRTLGWWTMGAVGATLARPLRARVRHAAATAASLGAFRATVALRHRVSRAEAAGSDSSAGTMANAHTPAEAKDAGCTACSNKTRKLPAECKCELVYAYMHSGCPLNRRELGRATWGMLHTMAAFYPANPTREQQDEMREFMRLMMKLYPCGYCADTTTQEMSFNPPRTGSRAELSQWLCEIHNEVNDRMGKPTFDCSRYTERWRTGPADGSCGY